MEGEPIVSAVGSGGAGQGDCGPFYPKNKVSLGTFMALIAILASAVPDDFDKIDGGVLTDINTDEEGCDVDFGEMLE